MLGMSLHGTDAARRAALLLVIAGALPLAIAFASQYLGGLQPCVLCIYQRYPYGVVIALGVAALAAAGRPALLRPILAVAGLAFLADAGIALFHIGVEQHWWQGTAACSNSIPAGLSLEELKKQLMEAPVVACDEAAWSLGGISMAGFNFLYALAAGPIALWAATRPAARAAVAR